MKHLLIAVLAVLTLVGTASATSSADCCNGGACCRVDLGCCAE